MNFDDEDFWPIAPDGFGFSLVLADGELDPDDARAWRASSRVGGSPGGVDLAPPAGRGVRLNEVLAGGEPPFEDAVELVNLSGAAVDIGGWVLSDARDDAAALVKYAFPAATMIPAGDFLSIYENTLTEAGLASLDRGGSVVYLASRDAAGALTGHIVELRVRGADANVAVGRIETSVGPDLAALEAPTFGVDAPTSPANFRTGGGAANADPAIPAVVLNEIHYHPDLDDDEFVELYNPTGSPVHLHDAALARGWKLRGVNANAAGDDFEFPAGATIEAGRFALVVGLPPEIFRERNGVPAGVPIFGPFVGGLDNSGEMLRLSRPITNEADVTAFIEVDKVRYNDRAPWVTTPDGLGPSLERFRAEQYGNDPASWAASADAGGTPGRANSASPPVENLPPVPAIVATRVRGDAPLEVRFDGSESQDPDGTIETYDWSFGDGGVAFGPVQVYTYEEPGSFTVNLWVADDAGARTRTSTTITVLGSSGGGQIAGDLNQDASVDISDAIGLLSHLFVGQPSELPCDGGAPAGPGNTALFDLNGDGGLDLSDPVYLLLYLFAGGTAPALGTNCTQIDGCPNACGA